MGNQHVYKDLQGRSEFEAAGRMKSWYRWADLPKIKVRTLTMGARYDEMDPEDLRKMATLLPRGSASQRRNDSCRVARMTIGCHHSGVFLTGAGAIATVVDADGNCPRVVRNSSHALVFFKDHEYVMACEDGVDYDAEVRKRVSPARFRRQKTKGECTQMLIDPVRPRYRCAGILLLFAAWIGGMKLANAATDPMRSLVQISAQRLQIARQVALEKWYSGARVEDPSREAQVLQNAAKDGMSMGLEPTQVEEFFKAQIEANKLIQYSLLADWRRDGRAPGHAAADLVKEIRPQLDEIEKRLIQELKQTAVARSAPGCPVDVARAVGEYLDSRSVKVDSLEGAALNRALAATCIR